MKKLIGLLLTTSIVISCYGQLFADDIEENGVPGDADAIVETADSIGGFDSGEPGDLDADSPFDFYFEDHIDVDFDFSNDELAEGYINQELDCGNQVSYGSAYNYKANLTDVGSKVYTYLYGEICSIAAGEETNTQIEIPTDVASINVRASDLGYSILSSASSSEIQAYINSKLEPNLILRALLNSCPYELYWFDKTSGWNIGYSATGTATQATFKLTFSFTVAKEYQDGNSSTVNSKYGTAIKNASTKAKQIISTYASYSDYNKLVAYKKEILSLTDYNYSAASGSVSYGNPWQMIWVFDGDSSTKVVCEGYCKAFQYLCDNSTFKSSSVYTICVTGNAGDQNEAHMWNVVHMSDGKNYIVDLTFEDTSGKAHFLKGTTSYSTSGFKITNGTSYKYDSDTMTFYGSDKLKIAASDYSVSTPTPTKKPTSTPTPTKKPTATPTPAKQLKNGWYKTTSGWTYYTSGTKVTYWHKISGHWYYFRSSGVMVSGWCKISGLWYYFNTSGAMVTGWQKIGSHWYYFNASGAMVTGWCKIGSYWYYFGPTGDGIMRSYWQKIGNYWYYFGADGGMRTGWSKIGNYWYYFGSANDGSMKTGLYKVGNYYYYFGGANDGIMKTGWYTIGSYRYYFDASGAMATGTRTISGKTYKFDTSGRLITK